MVRFLALLGLLCWSPAEAAPVEKHFNSWLLKCNDACVVTQDFIGSGYKVKAEVSVRDGENILRLVLPKEAGFGEDVAFVTRDPNQISVKPQCDETECIVTHRLDVHWLESAMDHPYLFVLFNLTQESIVQARFDWPMLQEAIMAARSR